MLESGFVILLNVYKDINFKKLQKTQNVKIH